MWKALARFFFFKILGWKFEGKFDPSLPKYIAVVAPHTSNWDFIIGVLTRKIMGIDSVKFLGKSQLFKWPFGWFFRALGGYPVDRSKHNNLVEAVVAIFNSKERFAIGLAPEGTRKKVGQLKTGFYHIAVQANVPIILVGFDFPKKTVVVKNPFYPSGDIEKDMPVIMNFFKGIKGKNPEWGL